MHMAGGTTQEHVRAIMGIQNERTATTVAGRADSISAAAAMIRPLAWEAALDAYPVQAARARLFDGETGEHRRQLLSHLLCHVRYTFHDLAKAHIYYCPISDDETIHSAHSFRDKAFDIYVLTCTHLSLELPDRKICEVLVPTSNSSTPTQAAVLKPCSGVVNLRLPTNVAGAFRRLATANSLNRACKQILRLQNDSLVEARRAIDPRSFGNLINAYWRDLEARECEQFTCRVGTGLHMDMIAFAKMFDVPLIGFCSFLIHRHLLGVPIAQTD